MNIPEEIVCKILKIACHLELKDKREKLLDNAKQKVNMILNIDNSSDECFCKTCFKYVHRDILLNEYCRLTGFKNIWDATTFTASHLMVWYPQFSWNMMLLEQLCIGSTKILWKQSIEILNYVQPLKHFAFNDLDDYVQYKKYILRIDQGLLENGYADSDLLKLDNEEKIRLLMKL